MAKLKLRGLAVKLIETIVTENHVRVRIADDEDYDKATQWVEFAVKIEHKVDPFLSELQREVLERAT